MARGISLRSVSIVAVLGAAAIAVGCAAPTVDSELYGSTTSADIVQRDPVGEDGEEWDIDDADDVSEPAMDIDAFLAAGEQDGAGFSASGSICTVSNVVGEAGKKFTVRAAVVTAQCGLTVAITGAGGLICLAPAGNTVLGAVVTGLAKGAAWLTCGAQTVTIVKSVAPPATGQAPAPARKLRECEKQDLTSECTVDECLRRQNHKTTACNMAFSCTKGQAAMACDGFVDRMRRAHACSESRRSVMRCFAKPDLVGHKTAIDQVCTGFRTCRDGFNTAGCGTRGFSLPLTPPACR